MRDREAHRPATRVLESTTPTSVRPPSSGLCWSNCATHPRVSNRLTNMIKVATSHMLTYFEKFIIIRCKGSYEIITANTRRQVCGWPGEPFHDCLSQFVSSLYFSTVKTEIFSSYPTNSKILPHKLLKLYWLKLIFSYKSWTERVLS